MPEIIASTEINPTLQRLEVAEQNGDFYLHLIDLLRLGQHPQDADTLRAEIQQLLTEIPPHFRRLYTKALNDVKTEFENGEAALRTLKNKYPEVPLEQAVVLAALTAEAQHYLDRPLDDEEIKVINGHANQIKHRQVTPGFHILEFPPPVFDLLRKYLSDPHLAGRSLQFAISVEPLQQLKVNMLPLTNIDTDESGEFKDPDLIGNERHEVHHALMNFLEAQSFTRPNQEQGEAHGVFRSFRHEVVGYLINCISSFDANFKPQWSIYSKFGDELNFIKDETLKLRVKNLIIEVETLVNKVIDDSFDGWYRSGFNLKSLLFAGLTASTFEELVKNIQNMIDLVNQKYRYSSEEREEVLQRARDTLRRPFSFEPSYDDDPIDDSGIE